MAKAETKRQRKNSGAEYVSQHARGSISKLNDKQRQPNMRMERGGIMPICL